MQAEARTWLMRVASRPEAGGGHMYRCAPLAGQLVRRSATAIFVLDALSPNWSAWLRRRGFAGVAEGAEPPGPYAGAVLDHHAEADTRARRYKSLAGWIAT